MSVDRKDYYIDREFFKGKNVLVTGGSGFLGSHLISELQQYSPNDILVPRSRDCDLRVFDNCMAACDGQDVVIHLAADVGGIGYNRDHPYDIAFNNILMAQNMVEAARRCSIKKFVGIGTVCAYPKNSPIPFQEENLWNGYPEETNAPYGNSKRLLLQLGQAAHAQYGLNAIHLLPVNLYGPGDNFNPNSSHVIPALIKKFWEAKSDNSPTVEVWGTGNATREFLYVKDAAKGIMLASQLYNSPEPVNIGSGQEISIHDLAHTIGKIIGYEGEIVWDTTKPDGQPRRMLDVSKADREFGFRAQTTFEEGLRETIKWYLNPSRPS